MKQQLTQLIEGGAFRKKSLFSASLLTIAMTAAAITGASTLNSASTENDNAPRPILTKELAQTQASQLSSNQTQSSRNSAKKITRAPYKGAPVNIAGSVIYSSTNRWEGLYSFTTDSDELTLIAEGEEYNASMGGVMAGSRYFSAYQIDWWSVYQDNFNYLHDATTWDSLKATDEADTSTFSSALAYDPTTNKVYGCFYGDNGAAEFATIDINTFTRGNKIATLPNRLEAMGCTSTGVLYGIDAKSNLVKIDKSTGATTTIGNTGIGMKYRTSGAIDTRTNRFFFASCNDSEKAIYEISLTNGAATYVCDIPEGAEIMGMWFPAPLADDKAPAAVQNLNVSFTGASLTGTVKFTAPTKLYDGSATSGSLTYTIKANGVVLASGSTSCGAEVTAEITVPQDQMYKITACVGNEKGDGPDAYKNLFVGKDTPTRVRDVVLTRSGKWNTVTWSKVTTMLHNGYIDPAQVTYTITRYPDGEVVKTGEKSNNFQEFIESTSNGEPCYYEVSAVFNGVAGEAGKSNSFALGVQNMPFTETFESRADFNRWLSIDRNGKNRAWDFNLSTKNAFCYNSLQPGVPMDAWLISPGLWMEKGRTFTLKYDINSYNDGITPERLEVKMGTTASPEGMTETITDPMVINYKTPQTKVATFTVPETGIYYIAFHGCSDPQTYFIDLDNVSITASEAPRTAAAPGLKVNPDETGAKKAIVEITAPTLTVGGDALASIEKIEIKRGNDVIKEITSPAPGQKYKFPDEVSAEGYYEYTAAAYTADGIGQSSSANVYIGVNIPGAPDEVKASIGTNPNEVILNWTAVDKTADGLTISSDLVKYNIYDKNGNLLKQNVAGTSATCEITLPESGQRFDKFIVKGVTTAGESKKSTASELIPVGEAYAMPFGDSFENKATTHIWAQGKETDGEWGMGGSCSTPVCTPQDSDNGMLVWVPSAAGAKSSFYSGKIHIDANASNPIFSFYFFGVAGSSDCIQPVVVDLSNGNHTNIGEAVTLKSNTGWSKVTLPFSDYKGKDIQIGFLCTSYTYEYIICIDNLKVINHADYDMAAVRVELPEAMKMNSVTDINVVVENIGAKVARDYVVELYREDNLVGKSSPATLGVDMRTSVAFTDIANATFPEIIHYYAKVILEGDENLENNTTPVATTSLEFINLPTVNDLSATQDGEGAPVKLTWTGIVPSDNAPVFENEVFDDASDFAINDYKDWTFYDIDGKKTYGIEGMDFPGTGQPMAYIVMNDQHETFNTTFAASKGHKYLAAFAPVSGTNDDWAISPELSGNAQRITFDAKSYTTEFGRESFEFLYSTTGKAVEDFKLVKSEFVPGQWTRYSFEVPEGAKYFAVRCISNGQFIFMIDNFTYEVLQDISDVSVIGYNIYRDNVKLNTTPVTETEYMDNAPTSTSHVYRASVVYSTGESKKGNEAGINESGITSAFETGVSIFASHGAINIVGAGGCNFEIYAADGKIQASGIASDHEVIRLTSGLYIARVGSKLSAKLLVK